MIVYYMYAYPGGPVGGPLTGILCWCLDVSVL